MNDVGTIPAAIDRPFKVEFELAEGLASIIRDHAPWRQLIEKLGEQIPDLDKLPLALELSVGDDPLIQVRCGKQGPVMWSVHRQNCRDFDEDPNASLDANYDPAAHADVI